MTKQEFVRMHQVGQMPKLVQVMIGKLYDAAFEAGRKEGYRQGVDAVALKQNEIYKRMYDEVYDKGARDATHRGSAAFTAAACKVLHRDFQFGAQRCSRVASGIAEELLGMLDPAETVREVREWGVSIDWDDSFYDVTEV